jgi:gamma-glutamyl phosphate reductase
MAESNRILAANAADLECETTPALAARLTLSEDKLAHLADGIRRVASAPEPVAPFTAGEREFSFSDLLR